MGREIRKVPAGWEHPRDGLSRHFKPLYDEDFPTAAREWMDEALAWENGTHEDAAKYKASHPFYWQWNGGPPEEHDHRPAWTDEERTHFQVYETVSEGTPVSPVFASLSELEEWLVTHEGHSRTAAQRFCEGGWAPSMIVSGGRIASNVDALDL